MFKKSGAPLVYFAYWCDSGMWVSNKVNQYYN